MHRTEGRDVWPAGEGRALAAASSPNLWALGSPMPGPWTILQRITEPMSLISQKTTGH